ncbi:MAG: ATP-binding protein [Microthrixaceae bacterium]
MTGTQGGRTTGLATAGGDHLFDAAPVGLVVLDGDGRVVRSNEFYRRLLGLADDGVGDELPVIGGLDPLLSAVDGEEPLPGGRAELELRMRRGDGSELWTWVTAARLPGDTARGVLVVGVEDLSADVELRVELAERRDEAIEQARARAEFVARVSHELRNQIHALHGLTELLGSDEVPRSLRGLAAAALRQAQEFEHLVDDLLEFSRMEAVGGDHVPVPTWPRQLVADAVHFARSRVHDGVTVTGETDESVPDVVSVDARRVRQVLANLVSNAAKFTETGSITVSLRNCPLEGGSGLELAVTDTGCGIPTEDLERIFQPFERSGSSAGAGTGLGLSITERAVQMLRGRISVESHTGRGATFRVVLPVEVAPDDQRPATWSAPGHKMLPTGAHVLVVEDNEVNQLLVAEQLRRLGARATVVGSGNEALDLLATTDDVDCVLMDWQLPGIDGLETTRRLRERESGRRLPIIGLTASAMPTDRQTCLDAGMDDLLVKPAGLEQLADALVRWTDGESSVDAGDDLIPADFSALDHLVEDLGSAGPVRSIVQTYLGELDTRCALIEQGTASGDDELVRRTAHTLKSTSRTLGAIDLDRVARTLEEGPLPAPGPVLDDFREAALRTRVALNAWLDRTATA